jgi:hypothetical protein
MSQVKVPLNGALGVLCPNVPICIPEFCLSDNLVDRSGGV